MSNIVINEISSNFAATQKENIEISQQEREQAKDVEHMSFKSENNEDKSSLGMMHTNMSVPWNNTSGFRKGMKCNYCLKVMKTYNFLQKHILRRHKQASKQEQVLLEKSLEKELNKDILPQNNKNAEIGNLPHESDLEELIAEAAVNIKYEIPENRKEKEEPLDPIADNFAKDMIEHDEGTLSCKVCNFVTSNTSDMYMHINIHIKAMEKKNGSKVLLKLHCEQCHIKFSSVSSLNAHKTKTHGVFIFTEELKSYTKMKKQHHLCGILQQKVWDLPHVCFAIKIYPLKAAALPGAYVI